MEIQSIRYEASGWQQALPTDMDSPHTLVIVFGAARAPWLEPVVDELRAAFPDSHLMGCSTAGEIENQRLYDNSMIVSVARFHKTRIQSATAPVDSIASSFAAGMQLAQQLLDDDLKAIFLLSDGLHINGSGLNSALPSEVIVTGGLAADEDRFESTWVLDSQGLSHSMVTAVGLYGDDLLIGYGSRGGWDRFGIERCITRSQGNILYELDHRPALDLYKEYLGERAAGLPGTGLLFPLAIRDDDASKQVVRTILAVDEKHNSITFAGDMPQGALAQLMSANFDRLIDGASQAAQNISSHVNDWPAPILALAVSCVGRRMILGERAEEEVEAVLDALPAGTSLSGFYSYLITPMAQPCSTTAEALEVYVVQHKQALGS
ncbi:MAG: FIST C-terminal domain-containing protein, partial [gamma proteobacterium symbiont of Bathyaustriella thionipta]|nr:FIST C-terminal domain-containing protein [gamma proteobacterium symbiont of Bathyaustriella thionipta]